MNLGTLIGIILGIGLVGYASFLSASAGGLPLSMLWDTVSFLIVLGGALAATSVAFKLGEVLKIFGLFGRVLKDDPFTQKDIVLDFIALAEPARKGTKELEKALESPPEHMAFRLKSIENGVKFVCDGYKKNLIREILENYEEYRAIREGSWSGVMKAMGTYTPAFGMVGTLIGLVFMLGGMAQPPEPGVDPAAKWVAAMAVALITTLYGAFFSNLFFLPFADKLKSISEGKKVESAIILEGVMLLADGEHPMVVRDKLNSFLERKERIIDEE